MNFDLVFLVLPGVGEAGYDSSLVNQTAPFPSAGCIASPARGREGLATLARFAWPISECGYDQ